MKQTNTKIKKIKDTIKRRRKKSKKNKNVLEKMKKLTYKSRIMWRILKNDEKKQKDIQPYILDTLKRFATLIDGMIKEEKASLEETSKVRLKIDEVEERYKRIVVCYLKEITMRKELQRQQKIYQIGEIVKNKCIFK